MKRNIYIISILTVTFLLAAITTAISTSIHFSSMSSLTLSNIEALAVTSEAGTTVYNNFEGVSSSCSVDTQIQIEVSNVQEYPLGAYFDYSIALVEKLVKANVTFTVIPPGYNGTIIECSSGNGDCTPYSCGM